MYLHVAYVPPRLQANKAAADPLSVDQTQRRWNTPRSFVRICSRTSKRSINGSGKTLHNVATVDTEVAPDINSMGLIAVEAMAAMVATVPSLQVRPLLVQQ